MTRLSLIVLLSSFALTTMVADLHAAESPISVSIAIPARNGDRRIEHRDRTTHFHVIISNTSDKPQRIWRETCSWGYYGLSFELSDEGGKKWTAKKKPIIWTVNSPSWWALETHESVVLDVYFGDADIWEGFPLPDDGSKVVMMKAVIEFKSDDESQKQGVWTGQTESKDNKLVFYHWRPEAK